MVIYGFIWFYMVLYHGFISWFYMVLYGFIWFHGVNMFFFNGFIWLLYGFMVLYGFICFYMFLYVSHMVSYGFICLLNEFTWFYRVFIWFYTLFGLIGITMGYNGL